MQDVVAQDGCSLPLINGPLQTGGVGGAGFLAHMTICMTPLLIWGSQALLCCHAKVTLTFKWCHDMQPLKRDTSLVSEFEDLLTFYVRTRFPFLPNLITSGKCEVVALYMKVLFFPQKKRIALFHLAMENKTIHLGKTCWNYWEQYARVVGQVLLKLSCNCKHAPSSLGSLRDEEQKRTTLDHVVHSETRAVNWSMGLYNYEQASANPREQIYVGFGIFFPLFSLWILITWPLHMKQTHKESSG